MIKKPADPAKNPAVDPTAAPEEHLSIEQVATLVSLPIRTVRYYIQQGLVSRPLGVKRGAFYERRHVEQLLLIRRWSDAGLSLDRIRELIDGAPEDAPPQAVPPGTVQVWSRVTLADGLELHLEPGRAGLSPEQARALLRGLTDLYRAVRSGQAPDGGSSNT